MSLSKQPINPWTRAVLSPGNRQRLLAAAQVLRLAGGKAQPLRGRHVAVVCEAPHSASAEVFASAAAALGAGVAHLRPSTLQLIDKQTRRDTVSALGRLYAAIECDGVAPSVVAVLRRFAGVPVFSAVAEATHPTWLLADQWTAQQLADDAAAGTTGVRPTSAERHAANHGGLVQALLSASIADDL